ncbi:neuralized-like protein 4 [Ischnura elegans]|uniref:neuralized-like protein 4 n=1 Tax=Ischnura elegans TaxID=197161 RepID=UPI001ED899BC|nr:neuralized-like protein 4 [Ischnura elegans]
MHSCRKMSHLFSLLFSILLLLQGSTQEKIVESTCKESSNKTLLLSINSHKEASGEWTTNFHATKSGTDMKNFTMDMAQNVIQCGSEHSVQIKGTIRGISDTGAFRKLKFHPICGSNVALSDDGTSAQKINMDEEFNGFVLTERPLRRNEMFEVMLDKVITKHKYNMGLGVTSFAPGSITVDHMNRLKSGNWMRYDKNFHMNGALKTANFGHELHKLKEGDRVGVMVNSMGTLHFFVNGQDEGPAAANLPPTLYGVFELNFNAAKGTIVDHSS